MELLLEKTDRWNCYWKRQIGGIVTGKDWLVAIVTGKDFDCRQLLLVNTGGIVTGKDW